MREGLRGLPCENTDEKVDSSLLRGTAVVVLENCSDLLTLSDYQQSVPDCHWQWALWQAQSSVVIFRGRPATNFRDAIYGFERYLDEETYRGLMNQE